MQLYTIGFAGRTAAAFFGALREAGVAQVADVRRYNTSQLAGYTKKRDLPWLLEQLCGARYEHHLALAPSPELFAAYRKQGLSFDEFADRYETELNQPAVDALAATAADTPTALLCSEARAEACHRSLLAVRLAQATAVSVVDL